MHIVTRRLEEMCVPVDCTRPRVCRPASSLFPIKKNVVFALGSDLQPHNEIMRAYDNSEEIVRRRRAGHDNSYFGRFVSWVFTQSSGRSISLGNARSASKARTCPATVRDVYIKLPIIT